MDACSCSRWVSIDVAQSFRTITCFQTLIPIHVISQPSTHYGSPYQINLLAHYARSVKIFTAGLPSTYDSRFRYSCSAYDADTLRFRCLRLFATASRFRRMISACIYHLRRSSRFYDFTSINRRFSDFHDHRHCDFHPRLRLRPSACDWHSWLTMSTRNFDVRFRLAKTCTDMRFRPAIAPAT
jgi:hypothetical protein